MLTKQHDHQKTPEKPLPPPPRNECLWCAKKLVIKSTIPGFCSETCFTTSRRARFKKEKFGIDTVPKRPTPTEPEATSSKVKLGELTSSKTQNIRTWWQVEKIFKGKSTTTVSFIGNVSFKIDW